MNILLTNDFSKALLKQEKELVDMLLTSVKKLRDLSKTEIIALDAVIKIPLPKNSTQLFAYKIAENRYAIFSFIKRNELLLVDYATLRDDGVDSLVYSKTSLEEST